MTDPEMTAAVPMPGPGEAEQVPDRVPAPAPAPPPPGPSAGPLSPAEEAQLGLLLARQRAAAAGSGPRLRVEPPHAGFSFGGVTVGSAYETVPAYLAGPLLQAAQEAGVTVTQDQGE